MFQNELKNVEKRWNKLKQIAKKKKKKNSQAEKTHFVVKYRAIQKRKKIIEEYRANQKEQKSNAK